MSPINSNPFFTDTNNYFIPQYQKDMYGESIQMFGLDVYYIPISFQSSDINWIFGEIPKISYNSAFSIRVFLDNYDEIHKAILSYNKFGMFIEPESLIATVSSTDYRRIVVTSEGSTIDALSGDLIYLTIHNQNILFEITHVENLMYDSYYEFTLRLYQHNTLTNIQTGIDVIDNQADIEDIIPKNNELIENNTDDYRDKSKQSSIWGNY